MRATGTFYRLGHQSRPFTNLVADQRDASQWLLQQPDDAQFFQCFALDQVEDESPERIKEVHYNFLSIMNKGWARFGFSPTTRLIPWTNEMVWPYFVGGDAQAGVPGTIIIHPRLTTGMIRPVIHTVFWKLLNAMTWSTLPNRRRLTSPATFSRDTFNNITISVNPSTLQAGVPGPVEQPEPETPAPESISWVVGTEAPIPDQQT